MITHSSRVVDCIATIGSNYDKIILLVLSRTARRMRRDKFTGILLVVARGEPNTARQVRWYVQYHLVVALVVSRAASQMQRDKCAGILLIVGCEARQFLRDKCAGTYLHRLRTR
mgnify:CR=1 FL=1